MSAPTEGPTKTTGALAPTAPRAPRAQLALTAGWLLALLPVGLWCGLAPARHAQRAELEAALEAQAMVGTTNGISRPLDPAALEDARRAWADLRARSATAQVGLERWFDALGPVPPGKEPHFADFESVWARERERLVTTHRGLGDLVAQVARDAPVQHRLRDAQRRFRIVEACLDALEEGGATRLLEPLEVGEPVPLPGVGRAIPVRVVAAVPFPRLAQLVRALLAARVCLRVANLDVTRAPFDHLGRIAVDGRAGWFPRRAYVLEGLEQDPASVNREFARLGEEPPLRVTLALEALDLDLEEGS